MSQAVIRNNTANSALPQSLASMPNLIRPPLFYLFRRGLLIRFLLSTGVLCGL